MDFEQLLALVLAGVEEGDSESTTQWLRNLYDKGSAYDDDLSVRDAKIAELTEGNDSLSASVQDLKARNYDLLMQIPAGDTENYGDGIAKENVTDEGEVIHIDNLFSDADGKED